MMLQAGCQDGCGAPVKRITSTTVLIPINHHFWYKKSLYWLIFGESLGDSAKMLESKYYKGHTIFLLLFMCGTVNSIYRGVTE